MRKLFLFIAALTLSAGLWAQENTELNPLPTPASNQIVYRTSDHQKITLNNADYFGVAYNDANSTYDTEQDYGIVSFDSDITTIGNWAFSNCTTLTAVVWPSMVTSIGYGAFQDCTNLNSINIQEGVTDIGQAAFKGCTGITELTIPSTVTNIGDQAFNICISLNKITCLATTPPICDGNIGVFAGKPIYVPKGSIAAYQSAEEWKDFTNIQAYTKNYGLYVKGEQVTFDNCGDILGDGKVSYDEISNTLTLNNANITYDGDVIAIYQDLVIDCVGTNTLTTNSNSYSCIMEDGGDVTITGSGSLSLISNAWSAIYTQNTLTISGGCTVTAQSAKGFAVSLADEPLTIDNATLIAKGNGKEATINGCSELIMKNGATIRTAHTYDAATHKFLNAAGEEAKDDIIIGVADTGLEDIYSLPYEGNSKLIKNGQLYIRKGNNLYNATGARVK